ncbi:hypothetical protein JTE90_002324 [Oedothorax gibbosus]|uniref:Uncharacterized protein n=1 Tax=Oedothorax gibbosus TaxID=931172 RepID=A0AAV6UJA5_9ARAC|nr:hypothetical protein JTE90_002324 [Oedothorax gibbosus]
MVHDLCNFEGGVFDTLRGSPPYSKVGLCTLIPTPPQPPRSTYLPELDQKHPKMQTTRVCRQNLYVCPIDGDL